MALPTPKVTDLFADATSAKKAAKRNDEFQEELNKALSTPVGTTAPTNVTAQLEALVANKSLSADALAALNTALVAQTSVSADLVKDITTTNPLSSSFSMFDLSAPARLLFPKMTPVRNMLPRTKGEGVAARTKRIKAITGSGTGAPDIHPGITESTTNAFSGINYNRGAKISYVADDLIIPYSTFSLSDQVSWDAFYSGQSFEDLRQLSSTSLLYASMLEEEKMLLHGRGTQTGFAGALSAPTFTAAAAAAGTGQVGLSAATYYFVVTADAGPYGQSVLSAEVSQVVTAGQVVTLSITPVAGAVGYRVYGSTGTGTEKYLGRVASTTAIIQGAASTTTTGDNLVWSTTGVAASTITGDTSAYAAGYDGIIPTILASGGYTNAINSTFSTSNPGAEFQTVFAGLYNAVKAAPDLVLLNAQDRKQLSDAIKSAGSQSAYRLNLSQNEVGDYVGGAIVGSILNESAGGKAVDLVVSPWQTQGVAPVVSLSLPFPDSQVANVWEVRNVQEYTQVNWPVNQFQFEASVYWRGALIPAAAMFNGIVTGIKSA